MKVRRCVICGMKYQTYTIDSDMEKFTNRTYVLGLSSEEFQEHEWVIHQVYTCSCGHDMAGDLIGADCAGSFLMMSEEEQRAKIGSRVAKMPTFGCAVIPVLVGLLLLASIL